VSDDVCRNTHWEDRFTCPACYHDHNDRDPTELTTCESCGAALECSVERVPESVCRLADLADRDAAE
jgi:transcription elongation factor Elf1